MPDDRHYYLYYSSDWQLQSDWGSIVLAAVQTHNMSPPCMQPEDVTGGRK